MSAIWGIVSFHPASPDSFCEPMAKPYIEKCKIDRIEAKTGTDFHMGCGIQYLTAEARKEELPIRDEAQNLCFDADCILDNRGELMKELGESDSSLPDGTLMYHAYLKWGMDCLNHFRGLFSLAVWDAKVKTLYLAADPVSSRCLYYTRQNDIFAFSTLLDPLRNVFDLKINTLYIQDFLAAPGLMPNIIAAETPYAAVYKLLPGQYLSITADGVMPTTYWQPGEQAPAYPCKTAAEYKTYFMDLYRECVKDALRTDGNVGLAMSSGFDSASVGVLAATELKKKEKTLFAYTYVPAETPTPDKKHPNFVMDETEPVKAIASRYPNMKTHFLCNQGKNPFVDLEKGMQIMEIPYKACVNLPSLCDIYENAVQDGCKVSLSGQFGNSTVSNGYIDDILYGIYEQGHFFTFARYLNHYSRYVKESRKQALLGCLRLFRHTTKSYNDLSYNDYEPDNPYLSKDALTDYPLEKRFRNGSIPILGGLPTCQSQYRKNMRMPSPYVYLGELETKMGLTYGLVLRDPTRDTRMLNFCYRLPYRYFAYQGIPRYLIREGFRGLLPDEMLDDWMRYGFQNADFAKRISRDWDQVKPYLLSLAETDELKGLIDLSHLKQDLDNFPIPLDEVSDQKLNYVSFLCSLGMFFQR